jgi:hypothetical protein
MDELVKHWVNIVLACTLVVGAGLIFLLTYYVWDKAFRHFLIFIGSWDVFVEILRDPRIDPQPGDVLENDSRTYIVIAQRKRSDQMEVHMWVKIGGQFLNAPVSATLEDWRDATKNWEVIERG